MKSVISIAAIAIISTVVAAPAFAQGERFKTACAKPGDERVIEIISPGDVGQVCDVRYTYKSSNTVRVPYHANSSAGFCATKAQEVVTTLAAAGFACANIADDLVVASAPAVKTPVVETTPAAETAAPQEQTQAQTEPAPTPIAAPLPEAAPEIASAPVEAPVATAAIEPVATAAIEIAQPETIAPVAAPAAAPAEIAVAPSVDADSLGDKLKSVLDQPAQEQHAAVRGPENLTDKAEPNVVSSGRQASVVGRLLGAEPAPIEAPEVELAAAPPATGVTPVTQASAAVEAPAPLAPAKIEVAATKPPVPAAAAPRQEIRVASVTKPAAVQSAQSARDPKDVIRATLRAQSAAWNEGNLDAFMETYWKSDALKFISGTSITNGWSTTQKRYRSRYANAAAMGQLGFEKMKVEMVSDDVAIVVGKFNLAREEKTNSGVFTLVMKRMDGAWRIVHDHTVGDAKS